MARVRWRCPQSGEMYSESDGVLAPADEPTRATWLERATDPGVSRRAGVNGFALAHV